MKAIIIKGKDYLLVRRKARAAAHIPVLLWWLSDGYQRDIYVSNGVVAMLNSLQPSLPHYNIDVSDSNNILEVMILDRKVDLSVVEERVRFALGLPDSVTDERPDRPWSKEWQPFTGYYEKEMVDIRLKNGDEVHMCWPNAGYMNPVGKPVTNPKGYEQIPYADVAEVRIAHTKRWP